MNAFDILVLTAGNIICLLVGYYVGAHRNPQQDIKDIQVAFKKATTKPGVVTRPSAATVNAWANPTQREADEAFKESFAKQTGQTP